MAVHITVLAAVLRAACSYVLFTTALVRKHDSIDISHLRPSQDPFYVVPFNITEYPRGSIIQSRKVPNSIDVFGPNSGDTYQLQFRTHGIHMQPDAAITTIVAPRNPAKGPPKIVAIASAVDSPAVDCTLSWALYPNSASLERSGSKIFATFAKAVLHQGYYVTLPDQEGSKAAWGAYSEGQVILDSILAIINHKETIPNSKDYRAALMGYSGGGLGAGWAGQLASTYGKGIPIVALAAGGIPADLGATVTSLDSRLGAAMSFSGVAGLSNVYPEFNKYMLDMFKPNGTEAFKAVRDGSHCLDQAAFRFAFKSIFGSVTDPNFLDSPVSKRVLGENHLGKHSEAITEFPVYQVHTQIDEIVPYPPALDFYHSQCSKGANITFTNPIAGRHMLTEVKALPSFVHFIKAAFEGTLPKVSECRQMTEFLIPSDGPEAVAAVSQPVVDELKRLARVYKITGWLGSL